MYRVALMLALAVGLVACQAATPSMTPTVPPAPKPLPSPTPTPAASGLFFDNLEMFSPQSGWAWKGISQLYRTDDGGSTWHEIHLQGKMEVTGASFLSGQEAWLPGVPDAALKRTVYHTTDGGQTWMALGSISGPNVELHFHDAQIGWALNGIGAAGNVFYDAYSTTDGGQSWSRLHTSGRGSADQGPMAGSIHVMTGDAVSFTPPNIIWISAGYGLATPYAGLTVSRDGGKTWRDLNLPLPADLLTGQPPVAVASPQFLDAQNAFLRVRVGERQVFFASHDGGDSWTLLPGILPAGRMMQPAQFVSVNDGFSSCGAGLCSTEDGGQAWHQIPAPFPFGSSTTSAFVSQFDFVDPRNGWAILADQQGRGRLLKTTDGGHTWIELSPRLGF